MHCSGPELAKRAFLLLSPAGEGRIFILIEATCPAALQERLVSGVGNWVADEVCFQACVHPGAKCNTLSPEQVKQLVDDLLTPLELGMILYIIFNIKVEI